LTRSAFVVAVLTLSFSVASAQDTVTIHWWHINTGDPWNRQRHRPHWRQQSLLQPHQRAL